MKIRVVSYNVQHCMDYKTEKLYNKEKIDFDAVANTIKSFSPDIIGLNEMRDKGTTSGYEAQVQILAEKLGYKYCYFGKAYDFNEGPYGNALISRFPILSAQTVIVENPPLPHENPDGYYEQRGFIKAKIDVADGLTVLVTHFGLNPDEHRKSIETFLKIAESEKCVFMGDFNVTPDSPILLPIRERMCDTADKFDGEKLSYPSDEPFEKIDYIFVTKDINTEFADIPDIETSDHRPYVADLII